MRPLSLDLVVCTYDNAPLLDAVAHPRVSQWLGP